jgi:hypothetical protein
MEVIYEGPRKQEVLRYLRECNKVVGLVEVVEGIHIGHINLIKKAKERCDIICVEFLKFWLGSLQEIKNATSRPSQNFSFEEDFVLPLKSIENVVDYVFCSEINKRILEEQNYIKDHYFKDFVKVHKELGIPSVTLPSAGYHLHTDVADSVTHVFAGPKCIVQNIVMRKVIPENKLVYKPEIIWNFFRDPKTGILISRTSGDITLGWMVKEARSELLSGKGDFSRFEEISRSMFLLKREFSIIDFKTVEKLDRITDNCVIVYASGLKTDYICVVDGKIIF